MNNCFQILDAFLDIYLILSTILILLKLYAKDYTIILSKNTILYQSIYLVALINFLKI